MNNWLTAVNKRLGAVWTIVTRGGLLALGSIIGVVVVWEVVREYRYDGISLESVIVKGPEGGPTVEMATQQIATYMDKIQRTGAREWRPHDISDGDQTVNIQIPGSSLNIASIVRELAGLFPHQRTVLKASITADPFRAGYVATIVISDGRFTIRETCETDEKPGALGRMFECLAVKAMMVIDPLFAASYVLSLEGEQCAKFQPERIPMPNPVAKEQRQLLVLRDYCGFERTRALVSTIISRGRPDDQPWVSYIYGKLHLVRADAVVKVDQEAQWYEFDRASDYFETPSQSGPAHHSVPGSALAIQMETYIKNSLQNQESVIALQKVDASQRKQSSRIIEYRLDEAKKVLDKAGQGLAALAAERRDVLGRRIKEVADERQGFLRFWTEKPAAQKAMMLQATADDEGRIDAMVAHQRGLVLYRDWMIKTRDRYQHGEVGFALGAEEEKQLKDAVDFFQTSQTMGRPLYWPAMDLGNALRALRNFGDAVKQYRRANDIDPSQYAPLLNVAIALLEKSKFNAGIAPIKARYDAMRQTSSYLAWISDGGPYDNLVDKIAEALEGVDEGNKTEKDFADCRQKYEKFEADAKLPDLSHTAALKLCVDEARDRLSELVAREALGAKSAALP
jgi:tetratricopeptide (TPR) repeat protein